MAARPSPGSGSGDAEPGGAARMSVGDEGWASVAGTALFYRQTGDGPPVVFVHGFALDSRMWDPQLEAFGRRFRVLTYDLRGFGRSNVPLPEEPYSPSEDLRALLEHLGVAKAHVVGLSAGGVVALGLALEHAELVDSALDGSPWSEEFLRSMGRVDLEAGVAGVEAARRLWLEHPMFRPARDNPEVGRRLAEIVAGYSGWHWEHESPQVGLDPPAALRLDAVRAPTLVVVGALDLPDFHRIGQTLAEGIPGATKAVVPGAGHLPNMEVPEWFNRLVLDFLDGSPGSPA